MFAKILIANRGEIACRVMATAHRLGIDTVAVFSDADAGSRHVGLATEAVRIGPAPAAESYLDGARIIAAALRTGAEAIHPGYGFLSENPDFAEAASAAGLVFVGPSPDAIRAMGLKDAAKTLMDTAGVPTVPGYHGADQDPHHLARAAARIGFPVLIKARAGGGGKGMRLVRSAADFAAALASARREARAGFGDDGVLVERYVACPRHVEVQIFGDRHGTILHLFERDCSLQRRHQKVIEEAPAPGMTEAVRAALTDAAVKAARAIGYVGAGTVEFIADGSAGLRADAIWFMEMNTRLQVEHPVSEAITGLDFVELQLRMAAGEALPFGQSDLTIDGHAIEARIYAEDVPRGFLPATGALAHLAFPGQGARIDSGVRQGDQIGPHYDPMIAKIITHGPNRAVALNKLRRALAETHIAGLTTNLDFLGRLCRHEGFGRGAVDTDLIAREADRLTAGIPAPIEIRALAALSALGLVPMAARGDPWACLAGWRQWPGGRLTVALDREGEAREITARRLANGSFQVVHDAESVELEVRPAGENRIELRTADRITTAALVRIANEIVIFHNGRTFGFALPDPMTAETAEIADDGLYAPMPGLVKRIEAGPGRAVSKGDRLVILEAMKMEHTLSAPRDGIIAALLVAEGDQLTEGALLLELEPEDG